ncbi:MAG: hypothetical protein IJC68_04550 [Firmicutes bacterium]|nr:hypothetical protein [Bacillota bacterium]
MKQKASNETKKNTKQRKFRWWQVPLGLIALVLLAVIGLLGWLWAGEYYPKENTPAEVSGSSETKLTAGEPIEILTWNVGYGALSATEDFFMDGGTKAKPDSADLVNENLAGISKVLSDVDPDFVLLQEVDRDSDRSYHVDQTAALTEALKGLQGGRGLTAAYALNYKCEFVPIPLPPMGKVDSGLLTLSTFTTAENTRVPLPTSYTWPVRLAQLKRCLLVTRIPIEGTEQQLVLVNLHLEAYAPEEAKQAQTEILVNFLKAEYAKGNYCIAGGDWNQTFPDLDPSLYPVREDAPFVAETLPAEMLPSGWTYAYDPSSPTARLLDQPYDPAAEDNQFYVIDGFMVSPNVIVNGVRTLDQDFEYSDHNPVLLTISLHDFGKYERSAIFEEGWTGYNVPGTITGDDYQCTELWLQDYVVGALGIPKEDLLSWTFDSHILTPACYMGGNYYGGATAWRVVWRNAAGEEETHTVQIVDFEAYAYGGSGYTTTRTLSGVLLDDQVIEFRRDIYAYLEEDPRFAGQITGFDSLDLPANAVVTDFPDYLFPGEYLQAIFHMNRASENLYAVVKNDSDGYLTNLVYCYFYRKDLGRVEASTILEGHFYGAYVDGETLLVDLEEGLYRVAPDGEYQLLETRGDLVLSEAKALVNREGDIFLLDRSTGTETLLLDATADGPDAVIHYQVQGALSETRFVFSAGSWSGSKGCGIYDIETDQITWVAGADGKPLPVRAVSLCGTILFVDEEGSGTWLNPKRVDLSTMEVKDLAISFPVGANGAEVTDMDALHQAGCYFQAAGPDGKTVLFTCWTANGMLLRVFDAETGDVLLTYRFSDSAAAFHSITYTHDDTIGILCRSYPSDTLQLLELPFGR